MHVTKVIEINIFHITKFISPKCGSRRGYDATEWANGTGKDDAAAWLRGRKSRRTGGDGAGTTAASVEEGRRAGDEREAVRAPDTGGERGRGLKRLARDR
jgi:hypothetical protein